LILNLNFVAALTNITFSLAYASCISSNTAYRFGSYEKVSTSTAVLSQLQLEVGESSSSVLDKVTGDGFYNSYKDRLATIAESSSSFVGLKLNIGIIKDI